jgi:5,5'-dehydrodivanillate O-demethylase
MQLEERVSPEDSANTAGRFYDQVGPGTPAGQYLRRFWTPVALLDDIAPGRARTVQVMCELFTYYRGESGTPHLIANECAHRHTRLAPNGIVEDDCIRCFYHGWKYDQEGQCVDQPAEGDQSFAHKVQIKSYPVREYLGLVFAYLGTGDPPPFPQIHLFEGDGVRNSSSYTRKTSFFNSLDNQADWVHANFVHARSEFTKIGINREVPVVTAEETEFGLAGYLTYSDGIVGVNYVLMPLAMYIIGSQSRPQGYDRSILTHQIAWRVPMDDNSHRSFNIYYADVTGEGARLFSEERRRNYEQLKGLPSRDDMVDAIYRGDIHVNEVDESRPDIVGIQDTVTMEMQRPISEREPDRLGRSDTALILLRKMWMREIRNMLAGEPMKEWTWPADLRAISQMPESR